MLVLVLVLVPELVLVLAGAGTGIDSGIGYVGGIVVGTAALVGAGSGGARTGKDSIWVDGPFHEN